MSDQKQS